MSNGVNLQPQLREQANEILRQLWASEREELLIKCWMLHDTKWFMAAAREYGVEAANRLNQIAAHEIGKAEAQRIVRALGLPPVSSLDEYLLVQEVLIALLEPELVGHHVTKLSDTTYRMLVQRCFARDNAVRTGIASDYECGIYPRLTGWLEGLGFAYKTDPAPGKCPRAQGQECLHTVTVEKEAVSLGGRTSSIG